MNIQKVHWNNSEHKLNLSFPISKVDKEKRTVSGFATLDNVDRHGDIVTADASEKAFARFRGNLREMHAPIAIGKVLSFHPEDYFDKESGRTFKGIYVNAYVSKGAQDTWEKVLDGTMTGFSIGGNIVTASNESDDNNTDRRVIKEYDLMELSLVDSPANPLANIFSIQKSADGSSFVKGMSVDTTVENVYWCKKDQIASSTISANKDCVVCGNGMENVGWIESAETEKGLAISKVIDQYLKKDDAPGPNHSATTQDGDAGVVDSKSTINLYPDQNKKIKKSELLNDSEDANKGGNNMADQTNNEASVVEAAEAVVEAAVEEVVAEVAAEVVAEAEAAPTEELVEKSVTNAEAEQPFAKMLTEMRDLFGEAINKNSADIEEKLQKSVQTVESARAEYESAVSQIKKELTDLTGNIAEFFKRFEELEKRFSSYENDTAVQKSIGDVDNSSRGTKLQKNLEFDWQGSFLGVQSL
jgi:phage shock protein A